MSAPLRDLPEVTHVVGQASIDLYAEISGDRNPLHLDHEYAAAGPFGSVIAHGPIGLQVLFEALTTWLGCEGLPAGASVGVAYRSPVRVGDTVTCSQRGLVDHAATAAVVAVATNTRGETVLEAIAVIPREIVPRAILDPAPE